MRACMPVRAYTCAHAPRRAMTWSRMPLLPPPHNNKRSRSRCKELKTARAHLLLYVRGSTTHAPTGAPVLAGDRERGGGGFLGAGGGPASVANVASVRAQLEAFVASREQFMDFSPTLSSAERARVHQVRLGFCLQRVHACGWGVLLAVCASFARCIACLCRVHRVGVAFGKAR